MQILFRQRNTPGIPFYEGKHLHDFIEIVYVESGSGWVSMNGQSIPCFPGDLYIMPLNTVHEFKTLNSIQHYNILITPDALQGAEHAALRDDPYYRKIFSPDEEPTFCHLSLPVTAKFRNLLASANECMLNEGDHFRLEFKSYILLILCEIFRLLHQAGAQLRFRNQNKSDIQNISSVVEFMSRHFREPLEIRDLAAVVKMNPAGFIRFFRKATGIPPIQYLNSLRILEACRLLRMQTGTEHSMSEIADMCGFSNSSYFAEIFKKIMDVTPSAFRARHSLHDER